MKKSYCLRIPEDLKLIAAMRARDMDMSLSDFVTLAVRKMILEDYHGGQSVIDRAIQEIGEAGQHATAASGEKGRI